MHDYKSIESFFTPKSICVIGASNEKGSVGYTIFHNMKKAQVKKIYPISLKRKKIQRIKAYQSISMIKEDIELAVIAVPARFVPQTLQECIDKKVKAVIIVSAGFSETGETELTEKLAKIISENPQTRVIGPNCVGILNNHLGLDTTFFEKSRMGAPKKGSLAFISQSGALGSMILDWVATQEFGISKFVSYGNAMDVDEADLLEYFAHDKDTKVITIYLEGARDGRKFFETAKRISKKKPIVVLKGGRNEETQQATASHTGSLAGSAKVYDAVFSQAGIIQADDLIDLFNIAKILEKEPVPSGNRVHIITNGGGFGIVTADQILSHGLKLAKLSKHTSEKLKEELPMCNIGNPIDLLGDADVNRYKKAIAAVLEDENVDIVMVLTLFNLPTIELKSLATLRKARMTAKKPTIVCSIGSQFTEKYMETIEKAGFTTFEYPSVAAKALKEMVFYSEFLKKN